MLISAGSGIHKMVIPMKDRCILKGCQANLLISDMFLTCHTAPHSSKKDADA